MFKGFYNLTSGMLTQQRNLNVVANNLVNVSTAGYKQDRYTASTFDDVIYSRVGNKQKIYTDVGRQSYIRASSQIYTDYSQGIPEPTDIPLDFAIEGEGFFAMRNTDGETVYTRAGSFSLDNEGYLCMPGIGRVLDDQGQEILVNTDKIKGDFQGNIFTEEGGFLGRLGVYRFQDNGELRHTEYGTFTGEGAELAEGYRIHWGYLERSNVDMVQQMTEMMTTQRALQSAAQVTKMYDQVMTKASTEIGRL